MSQLPRGGGVPTRFRLRQILKARKVSQSELARMSGVSFATVNRMCTNATETVALDTLERLSKALGVAPGELLERVPAKARR